MWGIITLIYMLISIAAFIWVFFDSPIETPPSLYRYLYSELRERYNIIGTIIPIIGFTIFCLPELIIYYFIMLCIYLVVEAIPTIWNKLFRRRK